MSDSTDLPYDSRRKLSDSQVVEIRSLAGSMTQAEIAARFGISQPQVSYILRGLVRKAPRGMTPYRAGWLAGMRFAADLARQAAANPNFAVLPTPSALTELSEGVALGASLRKAEWEAGQ